GATHVHETVSESVSVDGRDIGDLRLVTSRGWSLTGQVTGENGAASGIPNSRIKIIGVPSTPDADLKVGGFDDSGVVKDDGTFTVAGLFGPVRIRATLPAGWMVKSVLLNGRDITDPPIELGLSDGQRPAIQVVVTNRLTTITGQLVDNSGTPKPDSVVLIFPDSAEK